MSPSKESMRPRNTEAEKAEKWIEKMNGQVLSSIDVEDERLDIQNKGKVEFTCESPHGWTEDFSQAVWGPPENKDKRFAELNHAQKNLVLNAWMMLAHQGISLQNQTGVEWEVDFDQNPPSYKMKDRKGAREGSFVQPEYQEEIGHTREAIDELHQTDVARNVESAPGAVDPTVLDDSTEKGSIMHVLDAVGHGDLATRQARVNYFKSGQPHLSEPVSADEDPLLAEERAGVNKYLVEMLGQEKAEKYLIDIETGEGYRATAVQNRAWVQYIRYDRYEILDTPEQKEKHAEQVAGLLATIEQAGKAVQAIVPDFLDGDFAEYLTANVFVESFYEEGGEWKFTLGYDFKNKRTGKSIFEDGPRFVDGDYIGDDLENNIPRIVGEDIFEKEQESMTAAIGEEQAHQKSLEPSFKEDGERLRAGETERTQVQEMVESYLATKHRVPRGTIEVRWGKVGKFGSR